MKKLIALFLVLMLTLSMAACGSPNQNNNAADSPAANSPAEDSPAASNEDVVLTWSINETANLTREQYIVIEQAFEDEYPHIDIQLQLFNNTTGSEYMTKLSAGTLCDINHNVAEIAHVDGALAEVPAELAAKWDESYLFESNGIVNTVPVCSQGQMCVIYRKADFEKINANEPTTWEEFHALCDDLLAAGVVPMMGYGAGNQDFFSQVWAVAVLGNVMNAGYNNNFNAQIKDGSAKWTDDLLVDTVKSLQDWKAKGYFYEGSASLDYTNACAEFKNGTAAMMIDGVWNLSGLDPEEYGIFFLPDSLNSNYASTYVCYWGVNAETKHPEEAWLFVDWVLTGNGLKYYNEQILANDAQISVIKDNPPSYDMDPLVAEYYDQVLNVKDAVRFPGEVYGDNAFPNGFAPFLYTSISKAFYQDVDALTVMEEVQSEYEIFLAEQG